MNQQRNSSFAGKAIVIAIAGLAVLTFIANRMANARPETAARHGIQRMDSPAGPGSAEPSLTVAPEGDVFLSWLEPAPDSSFALRVARLAGERWTDVRTIRQGRDFFVNWADFPSVLALGNGALAAHWLQRNGKGRYAYGVQVARSNDGGKTWGAPVAPHRDNSESEHGFVALWRDGQGMSASWLDGRKYDPAARAAVKEMMVMAATFDPNGTPGPDVPVDERTCDCCQTSAAMTDAGPVVVYRDRTADEIRDIYISRRVNGTWTPPAPVHADGWHIAACPVNGPSVVARGKSVAVAWFTAANDSAKVKLSFSTDGGATFGAPVRIDNGQPAGRVHAAMLPNGHVLVSWIERIGGDTAAVRVRRVSPDGKIGLPTTVGSSASTRASGFPRMAVSGDRVIFAWTEPGKPSEVRTARISIAALR